MLLKCKCGFQKKADGHYEDYKCPLCNGKLQEKATQNGDILEIKNEWDNKTVSLADIVEKDCIDNFKQQIEEHGNDLMWAMIERNINNPITRLYYRKYFFLAGGIAPKGEF